MNRLTFFSDCKPEAEHLRRQVADFIDVRCFGLAAIPETRPDHLTLVAICLKDTVRLLELKEWIKLQAQRGQGHLRDRYRLACRNHARFRHRRF